MDRVELSVVVPVYKCDECLRHLHERLVTALDDAVPSFELVFVDDRSPDNSWSTLLDLARHDSHVKVVRLSRNFGQHAAITAGLEHSTGEWIVVMDCDLQDPPEHVPLLYQKAQEGFDVVLARRVGGGHSLFRRLASAAYFRVLNALLGTSFDAGFGNFSVISRQVRNEFLRVPDKDRHYLMILQWLGFATTSIDFPHANRYAGESSYTVRMLLSFAFDGLFFQTTTLLRWVVYVGFAVSALGALLASFLVLKYVIVGNPYPGWTSLGVLMLLLSGFIIVSTGITGLYVGKIFVQAKDRPLYVVDRVVEPGVVADDSVVKSGVFTVDQ
jgi:glycosyltransferase involved in cell wall biosynthesis